MNLIERAEAAERLLGNETLQEALRVILEAQVAVFKMPHSSQEEIMEAHRMVRALGAFEGQLTSFVSDGKLIERRQKKQGQHRG